MSEEKTGDQIELELDTDDKKKKEKEPEIQVVKAEEEEKKPEKKVIEPDEGIADLRKQLEAEKQARIEAEKRAQQAAMQAYEAKTEAEDSNLHLVKNAISAIQAQNENLKAAYRDAMAANDYDKVAELQQAMSVNAVRLDQLEKGKSALESKPKTAPPEVPKSTDYIESLASQVSGPSANWLRKNRNNLNNERVIRRMFRAHEDAIDEGIISDTPQYFDFIEKRLGFVQPEEAQEIDAMADAAKVTQKRTAPPAAPVSRSGTPNGTRPNTVRLTAEEREMAKMMKMTDQEYATNKLALIKEGKLN